MRTAECNIVLNSDGIITKKTLINSIHYSYDKQGQLIKKIITSSNKAEADTVINYEYNGGSEVITYTVCGNTSFTSHSATDD